MDLLSTIQQHLRGAYIPPGVDRDDVLQEVALRLLRSGETPTRRTCGWRAWDAIRSLSGRVGQGRYESSRTTMRVEEDLPDGLENGDHIVVPTVQPQEVEFGAADRSLEAAIREALTDDDPVTSLVALCHMERHQALAEKAHTVRERVLGWVANHQGTEISVYELASHIGAAREEVSRHLNKLRREGLIRWDVSKKNKRQYYSTN